MESLGDLLYFDNSDVFRQIPVQVIPDFFCRSLSQMYIGNLAESVDSGVCPAGAVNLDRASFQTAEYDLNLALDGGIGGVLPLPAVVAGAVLLD